MFKNPDKVKKNKGREPKTISSPTSKDDEKNPAKKAKSEVQMMIKDLESEKLLDISPPPLKDLLKETETLTR